VSLGGTYGYRFTPHITAEAGVFGVIDPYAAECDRFGCSGQDNRFIQVPFGLKFTLPLRNDRFELSAGGGGLYQRFSVSNPNPDFGETGTAPGADTSRPSSVSRSTVAGVSG
jgi:hypothetical protein